MPTSASKHLVRLHKTAGITDSTELIRTITANTMDFRHPGSSLIWTLLRHDNVVELPTGGAAAQSRTFAFRKVVRGTDRNSLYRRKPLVDEVIVNLTKTDNADWQAEVGEVSRRRDSAFKALGYLPERAGNYDRVVEQLHLLLPDLNQLLPGVKELEVDKTDPYRVTITLREGTQFDVTAQVNPRTFHIEVASDGVTVPEPIRAPPGVGSLSLQQSVTVAATKSLSLFVGKHLAENLGRQQHNRFTKDELACIARGYSDAVMVSLASQLLETKTLPAWQRRYLYKLRLDLINQLGQSSQAIREKVYGLVPRVTPIIKRYEKKWQQRKPSALDTPHVGLPTHTAMGVIPGLSNLPAALWAPDVDEQIRYSAGATWTPDPDQDLRYAAATGSTALQRSMNRSETARSIIREDNDQAPLHKVAQENVAHYVLANGVGSMIDGGARIAVVAAFGQNPVDAVLGVEGFSRRAMGGTATGISEAIAMPAFSASIALVNQAKSVAQSAGEAVDHFIQLQPESLLLHKALPPLIAETSPDDPRLVEALELLRGYQQLSRTLSQRLTKHKLSGTTLRTKEAPLKTPGRRKLLLARGVPQVVALAAGWSAAQLLGEGALGLLGLRSVADKVFVALRTEKLEAAKARERARRDAVNNKHFLKRVDDSSLEAQKLITQRLKQPSLNIKSLARVRRHVPSPMPYLKNAAVVSAASLPLSAVGFVFPKLHYLATGVFLSGIFSQITNELYSWVLNVFDYYWSIFKTPMKEQISLAENGPQNLDEWITRYKNQKDKIRKQDDQLSVLFSPDRLPNIPGEISFSDLFAEIKKRGSTILIERFLKLVEKYSGNNEELLEYLRSITPDYSKLTDKNRIEKVAQAFDESHERDITAIAKLKLMDSYIAEYVPSSYRLAMCGPVDQTPFNAEFVEFAHIVSKLGFVSKNSNKASREDITSEENGDKKAEFKESDDITGRLAAAIYLAAANNGGISHDSSNEKGVSLNIPVMQKLLPQAAKIVANHLTSLKKGWNLEELLVGKRLSNSSPKTFYNGSESSWLINMLENKNFRDRYVARVTKELSKTTSQAVPASANQALILDERNNNPNIFKYNPRPKVLRINNWLPDSPISSRRVELR